MAGAGCARDRELPLQIARNIVALTRFDAISQCGALCTRNLRIVRVKRRAPRPHVTLYAVAGGYIESAFQRQLITGCSAIMRPLRAAGGAVADNPVQTFQKPSNFQLLNYESTSDRFQSASQKTTYITAEKRSRAAKAGSLYARRREGKRLPFSFRPRGSESSTPSVSLAHDTSVGFCPPL